MHSASLQTLPTEILIKLLFTLVEPAYLGRLNQVNKGVKNNIERASEDILGAYWQMQCERDFQEELEQYNLSQAPAWKERYKKLSMDRVKTCKLGLSERRLFNWIRMNDLDSIKKGNFSSDSWEQRDNRAQNAIQVAVRYKRKEILTYAFELLCYTSSLPMSLRPLHNPILLIQAGFKEGVENLIQTKQIDLSKSYPLIEAASYGHLELLKLFLNHGAQIDQKNDEGTSAILEAASYNHYEVVEFLLDKKVSVNTSDRFGHSSLIYAANNGNLEVVKLLLSRGADIEAEDEDGRNALMYATNNDHIPVVKCLLEAGAKVAHVLHMIDLSPAMSFFLRLWSAKEKLKAQLPRDQIIGIMRVLPSFQGFLQPRPRLTEEEKAIIKALENLFPEDADLTTLRKFFIHEAGGIHPEKLEFILTYIAPALQHLATVTNVENGEKSGLSPTL